MVPDMNVMGSGVMVPWHVKCSMFLWNHPIYNQLEQLSPVATPKLQGTQGYHFDADTIMRHNYGIIHVVKSPSLEGLILQRDI